MPRNKPSISIIIVNYKVKNALFACLDSIYASKTKTSFEIIVVDNDEHKTIQTELHKKFPQVQYIKNPVNNGWGGGVNLGSEYATADYFYFLNPDTIVLPGAIDLVYSVMQKYKQAGVVSSLILDPQKKPHSGQGSKELTPLWAMIVYSFINKFFPDNIFAKKFWLLNLASKQTQKVPIATLTGALVRKEAFEKAGKFDEHLFLYFEEQDLGIRINKLGYYNYIVPESQIVHAWGLSSQTRNDINEIFAQSRFYFFKKHYGIVSAFFVDLFLKINKQVLILTAILLLAAFLRFYRLTELMSFIGDQAWFYLSARDILLTGHIPLVGITSSHIWLHQGPLWTYLITPILWIFHFDPIAVGYFAAILETITVWVVYKVSKTLFSEKVGLVAAALYATSPLIVGAARMPYHTTPIPLLVLLLMYSFYQWFNGQARYFPIIFLLLGLLYNFELNTVMFLILTIGVIVFGLIKKSSWMLQVTNRKMIILSSVFFILPMIPIFIYDFSHKFVQTLGLCVWILYKIVSSMGLYRLHGTTANTNNDFFPLSLFYVERLIFGYNAWVAFGIFIAAIVTFLFLFLRTFSRKKIKTNFMILGLFVFIPLGGYLLNKTPSEAYLHVLFPGLMMMLAVCFDYLFTIRKIKFVCIFLLFFIIILNTIFIVSNNFFVERPNGYGPSYAKRVSAAKEIVANANGREYNLVGKGNGSEFASYTMNYEYLTWLLGNPPSKERRNLKITVSDTANSVSVK